MIKIRKGIFETNSSSTHSCILCGSTEYDEWSEGEVVYINNIQYVNKPLADVLKKKARVNLEEDCEIFLDREIFTQITLEEIGFKNEILKNITLDRLLDGELSDEETSAFQEDEECEPEDYLAEMEIYATPQDWANRYELEWDITSNERLGVVAICRYGYDG